ISSSGEKDGGWSILRPTQAAGAVVAVVGAIALVIAAHNARAERTPLEDGFLTTALAYERVLALLGMALATARHGWLSRACSMIALASGMAGGIAAEGTFANSRFVADHLFVLELPGPLACVIAGSALALPAILQKWTLPFLAFCLGLLIGLAIGLAVP